MELLCNDTDYEELNERIVKTLDKKTALLQVLEYHSYHCITMPPSLAQGAGACSWCEFQTRSEKGTLIKDTFMTINQTAKKLGVSFYDYVYDREYSGQFELPSLAELITQNTQTMPVWYCIYHEI